MNGLGSTLLTSLLGVAATLAACGGSPPPRDAGPSASGAAPPSAAPATAAAEPAPTAEPSATPRATAPPEPAKPAWQDLGREQKSEVMKTVVVPKMTPVFQEMDAKEFATVTCVTCHGSGAKAGNFAMPTAALPKLTSDGTFAAELKKYPKETKLMMERVVPEMAASIGVAPYDPATKQGLGCFSCHERKK